MCSNWFQCNLEYNLVQQIKWTVTNRRRVRSKAWSRSPSVELLSSLRAVCKHGAIGRNFFTGSQTREIRISAKRVKEILNGTTSALRCYRYRLATMSALDLQCGLLCDFQPRLWLAGVVVVHVPFALDFGLPRGGGFSMTARAGQQVI